MIFLAQACRAAQGPLSRGATVAELLSLSPALLRTLSTITDDGDADAPSHDKRYVDRLKITVRAGKGGNGCISFYHSAGRGEIYI
jgi:hypothetical protein